MMILARGALYLVERLLSPKYPFLKARLSIAPPANSPDHGCWHGQGTNWLLFGMGPGARNADIPRNPHLGINNLSFSFYS